MLMYILLVFLLFHTYIKWKLNYWNRKGVPVASAQNIIDHHADLMKHKPFYLLLTRYYNDMKELGYDFCGFNSSIVSYFMPISPQMVKEVLSESFDSFSNRGFFNNEKDDPLSTHLFSVDDEQWTTLRKTLSSAFSPAKTKMMIGCLVGCGQNLRNAMRNSGGIDVDVKELLSMYSMDVISACAFGLDLDIYGKAGEEFRKYGEMALEDYYATPKFIFVSLFGKLARRLKFRFVNKEVSSFFRRLTLETIKYRKDNNLKRDDFLQLLINLKNEGKLTLNQVCAQTYVFFVAGFNTTSLTSSYCLHELSKNLQMQKKVREELLEVLERYSGKLDHEAIKELKYMEKCIEETLRYYPPVPTVIRECTKDYKIPSANITISKGTKTLINIHALHGDHDHFPNPEVFDPERFSEENRTIIKPYTYLPFGEGPRFCLAYKFSMAQIKIALASILREYQLSPSSKTASNLGFNSFSIFLYPNSKIYLMAKKING